MKIKTKQLNIFLLIIAIIFGGAVLYFKFYISDQAEKIVETKKQNHILFEKINSISNLKQKIAKMDFYFDTFNKIYVDREGIFKFINLIENKAENLKIDLVIDNIDLDKSNIKEGEFSYGVLNLNVTASGNFNNLNNFLIDLEKMPYFVDLINIKISLSEKDKGVLKLALRVLTN